MDSEVHIVFGFDNNYSMQVGVAILSICIHTSGPVCFHALIAEDVTDSIKRQIEDMVVSRGKKIIYHVVSGELLRETRVNSYFSRSVYSRLLIADILSPDIHKAIYLDCDIITLQSLRPMWEIKLDEDEPAAMAIDLDSSDVKHHNNIGIPLSQPYFNSGVILMNLDCWRKEGLSSFFIQQASEHDYLYVDQDVLNANIGERVRHLHMRFNLQHPLLLLPEEEWLLEKPRFFEEVYEAKENPVVIHYVGPTKPWHEGCLMADDWLKYKAMSPWKDVPLQRVIVNGPCAVYLTEIEKIDVLTVKSIANPLFAIVLKFAEKCPRSFSIFRKSVWAIARRLKLVQSQNIE